MVSWGLNSFARENHMLSLLYSSMRVLSVRNSIQLFRSFSFVGKASGKIDRHSGSRFSRTENYEKPDHLFRVYAKNRQSLYEILKYWWKHLRKERKEHVTKYQTLLDIFFPGALVSVAWTLAQAIDTNGRTNGFFLSIHLIQALREIVHSFACITRFDHGPLNRRHRAH